MYPVFAAHIMLIARVHKIIYLHTFIYGGVFPFGAFTIGSISEHWGVSWAFRVAGLFGLGGLSLVVAWWRLRARGA